MHALKVATLRRWRRLVAGPGPWLVASVAVALLGSTVESAYAQTAVLTSTRAPQPAESDGIVPVCKTDLRLSGSLYDGKRPERSFAIFQLSPNQPGELYRAGMRVGAYELMAIEPRGVLLRNAAGDECWLRLVGDPVTRARRVAAPPPTPKPNKAPKKKGSEVVVIGHH